MRLVGPNCLGILNTAEHSQLNVTFAPGMPAARQRRVRLPERRPGARPIDLAGDRGLGVSSFASIGNRADITANDLLEYWERTTRPGRPALHRVVQRPAALLARRQAGRSRDADRGREERPLRRRRARHELTHGGAARRIRRHRDALFEQSGVIRAETLAEMLDVASLLANQPLPAGPRVGISRTRAARRSCAPTPARRRGSRSRRPRRRCQDALREFLPAAGLAGNPVDMIATATAEHFRATIEVLAAGRASTH